MARTGKHSPLDELVDQFFGGVPPSLYDAETLKAAMVRQIVNCHALIHLEMNEAMNPMEPALEADSIGEQRNDAYDRIRNLTGLIAEMSSVLDPRPEAGPPEKRHAIRIEVNRTPTPALPAPSAQGSDAAAGLSQGAPSPGHHDERMDRQGARAGVTPPL